MPVRLGLSLATRPPRLRPCDAGRVAGVEELINGFWAVVILFPKYCSMQKKMRIEKKAETYQWQR